MILKYFATLVVVISVFFVISCAVGIVGALAIYVSNDNITTVNTLFSALLIMFLLCLISGLVATIERTRARFL